MTSLVPRPQAYVGTRLTSCTCSTHGNLRYSGKFSLVQNFVEVRLDLLEEIFVVFISVE